MKWLVLLALLANLLFFIAQNSRTVIPGSADEFSGSHAGANRTQIALTG